MIQISDCPDTGLERFITAKNTLFYETVKQVILECHISHYKNGDLVENSRIKSYQRDLVATDDTPVDPMTGMQRADWSNPTSISEYQFFKNLKSVAIIQENMELQIIQLRDYQGKFNI